jgi:hypothetical protein
MISMSVVATCGGKMTVIRQSCCRAWRTITATGSLIPGHGYLQKPDNFDSAKQMPPATDKGISARDHDRPLRNERRDLVPDIGALAASGCIAFGPRTTVSA